MLPRTRVITAAGAALAAVAWIFLAPCSMALAADRLLTVQLGGGIRTYSSQQLGLEDAANGSLRVGLGMTDRVTVALEGSFSSTNRSSNLAAANAYGMRAIAQVDLLEGATRPYLLAGGGVVAFDFGDAQDTSVGIGTIGGGISRRLGPRTFVALEAAADIYGVREIDFDVYGNATFIGHRRYWHMTTVTLSLGHRF